LCSGFKIEMITNLYCSHETIHQQTGTMSAICM
jgi:hypothetical protein